MSVSSRESEAPGTVSPPRAPHAKDAPPLDLATRLALRPREAAAALGISERTFRSLLPRIPHLREGDGAVLIPVDVLREWLRSRAAARQAALDDLEREFCQRIAETK